MRHIHKTRDAEIDLEDIWLYSFEQWNEEQADRYYDQILDGIEQLIDNPEMGKSRAIIRSGYRSIQVNSHIVYYRIEDDAIRVIRVLHERMLPTKHL